MPQGMFDLNTLAGRIKAHNPNLPPQAFAMALMRATPLLNAEGRMQLAQMQMDYKQRNLDLGYDRLRQQGDIAGARLDLAKEREGRMRDQFDQNQQRLRGNADRRFADSAARLEEMTKRRLSGEEKSRAAQEIRMTEDQMRADHNAIIEQIQSNTILDQNEKKRLIDEANAKRDENMKRLDGLRAKIKAGGGGETAGGGGPAPQQPRPRATNAKGEVLEFDGQNWVPVK